MSCYHDVHRWVSSLCDGEHVAWSREAKGDIIMGALMLPLAAACVRWPIDERVVTTDATLVRGGATEAYLSPELCRRMYYVCEQRGCPVSLRGFGDLGRELAPRVPEVAELVAATQWRSSRSRPCRRPQHINLQEVEEVLIEAEESASSCMVGRLPRSTYSWANKPADGRCL